MALITQAPRGTQDVLPETSYKWQYVEQTALSIARDFGFHEIRTPVFEHTNLFQRSVGETTDVVQKEMYTFEDKGGRSITLRPEGTAGAARAVLEHGLLAGALPVKVSYITSCYRYEEPKGALSRVPSVWRGVLWRFRSSSGCRSDFAGDVHYQDGWSGECGVTHQLHWLSHLPCPLYGGVTRLLCRSAG